MKKFYIILTILLISSIHANSQELDISKTLSWHVVSVTNKSNSETLERKSEVIVYGKEKIEWVQEEASRTYTFLIEEVTGSWTDASKEGVITYKVKLGESSGTIAFKRQGTSITIDFDLKREEKTTFPFILTIDVIQNK